MNKLILINGSTAKTGGGKQILFSLIEKINEDDSLLDYEDKIYSNFSQLKDSFLES